MLIKKGVCVCVIKMTRDQTHTHTHTQHTHTHKTSCPYTGVLLSMHHNLRSRHLLTLFTTTTLQLSESLVQTAPTNARARTTNWIRTGNKNVNETTAQRGWCSSSS